MRKIIIHDHPAQDNMLTWLEPDLPMRPIAMDPEQVGDAISGLLVDGVDFKITYAYRNHGGRYDPHALLAPDDTPDHLRRYHGVQQPGDLIREVTSAQILAYRRNVVTCGVYLDAARIVHERLHQKSDDHPAVGSMPIDARINQNGNQIRRNRKKKQK